MILWHVTLLCSRNSVRKAKAINKSKFYFTSFLTAFTALLAEIKAFLTGHKHLVFFGLLNPCSSSSGHGHRGGSIRDWLERRPLGEGELTARRCEGSPLTGGRASPLNSANTGLGCGLGRNGHHLLIVFGTYCVILEERKGTRRPLVEI